MFPFLVGCGSWRAATNLKGLRQVATDVIIDMSSTSQGLRFRGSSALSSRQNSAAVACSKSSRCRFLMSVKQFGDALTYPQQPERTPNSLPCFLWFRITISIQYEENYTRRHSDSWRPPPTLDVWPPSTPPSWPWLCSTFRAVGPFGSLHYFMD